MTAKRIKDFIDWSVLHTCTHGLRYGVKLASALTAATIEEENQEENQKEDSVQIADADADREYRESTRTRSLDVFNDQASPSADTPDGRTV